MREPQLGKTSGCQARKYIRTTDHLLSRIGEICGTVDSEAIEIIRSWPRGYVSWKCRKMLRGAGPETAPHSAISPLEAQLPPGNARCTCTRAWGGPGVDT